MKLWDLIRTANGNLWHNKVRTILTIIAIFVGGFVITLMVGVNAGVNDYIDAQIGGIGGQNLIIATAKQPGQSAVESSGPQKYDPNTTTDSSGTSVKLLTDSDIKKIQSSDSKILSVTPDLSPTSTWISGANGTKYTLSVAQMISGINISLAAGTMPNNDSSENQIMIQTDDVSALGYKTDQDALNKTLNVGVKEPTGRIAIVSGKIVGVQNKSLVSIGGDTQANIALSRNMRNLQMAGLASSSNQYQYVSVIVKSGLSAKQITDIRDKITNSGYRAISIQDEISTVSSVVNAITAALIGFGAIALLAASFGIINTLFMSVQERTKEIGLMKAMGMSRAKVFFLFSIEAVLIGFWGSVVSVFAAIGVGQAINSIATKTFLSGLDGFVLLKFNLIDVASVVIIIMLIAFLAGTLPARRASKKDPIEALRYE